MIKEELYHTMTKGFYDQPSSFGHTERYAHTTMTTMTIRELVSDQF